MFKYLLFIFAFGIPSIISAQFPEICHRDTVQLILAYEAGGQSGLGDMIFKENEFVKYNGSNIHLNDYKNGVYQLPQISWFSGRKIENCSIKFNIDSILDIEKNIFDELATKEYTFTNKTFAGKKQGFVGGEYMAPSLLFKWKLFQVKIVTVYLGLQPRRMVNMNRKSKADKESVEISCPVFWIDQVLDVQTIK